MDIILFIPLGVVLLIVLIFAGVGLELVKAATEILFISSVFVLLFIGLYVIVHGIKIAKEEKNLWWGITETLRGMFISTISLYIFFFFCIGCGRVSIERLDKAKFIFFGTFDRLDIFMVVFLLSVFSVVITAIPAIAAKNVINKGWKFAFQIIYIILIVLVYIGIFKIGIKSEFINSRDTFNWDSPEYEVSQDATVKHEFASFGIKTGIFEKGTKLYANGHEFEFGEIKHFEVTDGVSIGYVSSENLEPLVEYSYFVNVDSNIYGIKNENVTAYTPDGKKTIVLHSPTDEILETVSQGTQVELTGTKGQGYTLIRLPDGTEGYIENENLQEIRRQIASNKI